MTDEAPKPLEDAQAARLRAFAEAVDLLVRLHDREVDLAFLSGLRAVDPAAWLGGLLDTEDGRGSAQALAECVSGTPDAEELDALAAEYADIHLTHGYRVSPNASVWLTEDHLERQQPMFDVRDWYAHYDIAVPNWRVRADDHLVHELQFVSFLCGHGNAVAAQDAARFLDTQVLPWVPEFCRQAAGRVQAPLYIAIMALTAAVLDELRTELEAVTGIERNVLQAAPPKAHREYEGEDVRYIPGLAESW